MSSDIKNNILKHDIKMPKTLSRSREKNSDYLMMLGRKAKGEATPKVAKIIELYNLGIISQVETAENNIIKLINAKTEKQRNSAFKQYDKIIDKHETKEPLSKRLFEKKEQRKKQKKYVSGKNHPTKTVHKKKI